MRPASAAEIPQLWPAVASAHVFASGEEFARYAAEGSWRVRVGARGELCVLGEWRAHLDVLAMRGVWAPAARVRGVIDDTRAVAREYGFTRLMSPLLPVRSDSPYRAAGMEPYERIVAFSAALSDLTARDVARAHRVDEATPADVPALAALDRACFSEFWRHGEEELREALREGERVSLVRDADGAIAGSAVSAVSGSVVTVGRLAVTPGARRTGVGSALLMDARDWARERGAMGLSLCTQADNTAARTLYGARGFREAPDEYTILLAAVD